MIGTAALHFITGTGASGVFVRQIQTILDSICDTVRFRNLWLNDVECQAIP